MTGLPKARGLTWRRRSGALVAYWLCNKPATRSGFPIKTQRVWSGSLPSQTDKESILLSCRRLNREMKDWLSKPNQERPSHGAVRQGFIYFARCDETIKIGFSDNVARRVRDLQTGSGRQITLMGCVPATPDRERILHQMFRHLRVTGEWFQATPELVDYLGNMLETTSRTSSRTSSNVCPLSP